jgi:hypothetical protein
MAGKKTKKKSSKADAMRRMREGAPAAGEPTDVAETKAQKKKREAAEKKETLKAEKKAAKEAAAKQREEDKAQKKREREEKSASRKAEKEAKRRPKTGALTIEQVGALPDGKIVQTLPELSEEDKISLADKGDAEIRKLEGRFIAAAIIIRQFMVYELWKLAVNPDTGNRGFKSIEKWAANAMPMSRSERFKAIKVAENLVPHIPEEDLKKMSSRNLQLLVNVPKAKLGDPEIISAAKGSEKKLRKTVNKKAPESGVEETQHLMVPKSIRELWDEAIEAIMALHELTDKYEAMEGLAVYFMQGHTENPNFMGMSNRDAYAALKDRQEDGEPHESEQELHVNGEQSGK